MRRDPTRLGRGLALLGLALVIAKLLVAGQMVKYMAPGLDPLSAVTAVVLAVMGGLELATAGRGLGVRAPAGKDMDDPEESEAPAGGTEAVLTCVLVGFVLALGLFVTPRVLGSSGLGGERIAGLILRFPPGVAPPASAGAREAGPLDDVEAVLAYLRTASDPGLGRRVRVTGTVARSDELGPGEFALLRYSIAHCVADARPVALLVAAPGGADSPPWKGWGADQWIEVEGVLAARDHAGDRLVTVEATRMRPIEEPGNPYLSAAY